MGTESVKFKKMQGTGNDFVIIDNRSYKFRLKDLIELAPSICDRKFGVGADGLLVLSEPQIDGLDYTMIYRNADGSDAGMCGNGAHCLALFAHQLGYGEQLKFNVHENIYRARVNSTNEVEVSFPVSTVIEEITVDGEALYQLYTGTEHVVEPVEREALENEETLRTEGRHIRIHKEFRPVGTNVNFICGTGERELQVQTYERGVENLTLACGTGAIASALVWHHIQQSGSGDNEYLVKTKGGDLRVYFKFDPASKTYSDIKLKGQAHFVFDGVYYL